MHHKLTKNRLPSKHGMSPISENMKYSQQLLDAMAYNKPAADSNLAHCANSNCHG